MSAREPFLRWAGGKRQLLPSLLPSLPSDLDLQVHRYFEPFVGGGALMFALGDHATASLLKTSARKKGRPLVVNDVNEELTATYRAIQDDVEGVIAALQLLAADTSEQAYYKVRAANPLSDVDRAARTIYLNKLNFNGLYRVNGSGGFNVPYGRLASPTVCNADQLRACSSWLSRVEIRSGSYTSSLSDTRAGDLVYFDPPYIPLSTTSAFSKYAKDDFKEFDQAALAGVIRHLTARGVRVVFSNSDTQLTLSIFGDCLHLFSVSASRSIGAAATSRGAVQEVIGVNFDPATADDPSVLLGLRRLTPTTLKLLNS